MRIRDVLNSKPKRTVVTVKASATVQDAIDILGREKIGTVVVSDDGKSANGILSERDIVRRLATEGTAVLQRRVDDVMTRAVVTRSSDESLDQVLATMTKGRFRHLPVVDEDKMVGLISLGDAVKARLDQVAFERDALEDMIMGR